MSRDRLQLRHDHGSQYISSDFQGEIGFLSIESSPAFVRSPEGNGRVERAIRTLKEQLPWVPSLKTEESRVALLEWSELNNEQWLVEHHRFRTPAQRRHDYYAASAKMAG